MIIILRDNRGQEIKLDTKDYPIIDLPPGDSSIITFRPAPSSGVELTRAGQVYKNYIGVEMKSRGSALRATGLIADLIEDLPLPEFNATTIKFDKEGNEADCGNPTT